ncbi:hypothetical protein D9758_004161 [Tetrapyrgos nigripes]|uniref:VWFA domain-containing protein n=1 Tax=Tetrapyrgos nigripes TaxID=182062 RepID=A0A8H5GUX8_9AGAR|nr:hypothetical protein D9758_004161 [Tetrapyrgos nigripes]
MQKRQSYPSPKSLPPFAVMTDKKSELDSTSDTCKAYPEEPPAYSLSNAPYSLPTAPHTNATAVACPSSSTSFLARSASTIGKMLSFRRKDVPDIYRVMETVLRPILEKFDVVFIVDDSGSMSGSVNSNSSTKGTKWEEARKALIPIAVVASHIDEDGIDIHFINSRQVGKNLKVMMSASEVIKLFDQVQPSGATPLGETLRRVIGPYEEQLRMAQLNRIVDESGKLELAKVKPVNYIVITDGIPTDESTEKVLTGIASRIGRWQLPREQVGVQFVQIGDCEQATLWLQSLDDSLCGKNGYNVDIVDTTVYSSGQCRKLDAEALVKILVGSINRRVDREGAKMFTPDLGIA